MIPHAVNEFHGIKFQGIKHANWNFKDCSRSDRIPNNTANLLTIFVTLGVLNKLKVLVGMLDVAVFLPIILYNVVYH
jgi:hypothetical protein